MMIEIEAKSSTGSLRTYRVYDNRRITVLATRHGKTFERDIYSTGLLYQKILRAAQAKLKT